MYFVVPEKYKKKMVHKFRIQSRRLLLTFPKCDQTKEAALVQCLKLRPNLRWAIVSREKHKDGTNHLHAVLRFHKVYNSTKPTCLDFIGGKHGNYKVIKGSMADVVRYVVKDDDIAQWGVDAKMLLAARKTKAGYGWHQVAKMGEEEGMTFEKMRKDPTTKHMCWQHKKKIEEMLGYIALMKAREKPFLWKQLEVSEDWTEWDQDIGHWLNENIKNERGFKQRQLYIHGCANVGKTHLVETLKKMLNVFHIPRERYYDKWYNNTFDLAVMDEYKGNKNIPFLNEFLQGSSMALAKKGSQVIKAHNIPTIILSNYGLNDLIMQEKLTQMDVETLLTRLEIVYIHPGQRIDVFKDYRWKRRKTTESPPLPGVTFSTPILKRTKRLCHLDDDMLPRSAGREAIRRAFSRVQSSLKEHTLSPEL